MKFKFSKWIESKIFEESMDVRVNDYEYPHEMNVLGDVSNYLQNKLLGDYMYMGFMSQEDQKKTMQGNKLMTPDDIMHYMKNRPMEQFSIDGGSDYFGKSGVINFYYQGLPQSKVQQFIQAIKYLLDEVGVKYGPLQSEDWQTKYNKEQADSISRGDYESEKHDGSDSYEDKNFIKYTSTHADRMKDIENWYRKIEDKSQTRVVRIPILGIPDKKGRNEPPQLNLSNANAVHIFRNVLDMKQYEDDGGFFNMPAADIIIKIDTLRKPEERKSRREGGPGTGKSMLIDFGLDADEINKRLMVIRQIAQWALDNGYDAINVV